MRALLLALERGCRLTPCFLDGGTPSVTIDRSVSAISFQKSSCNILRVEKL
jgi:hypothetical protein